MQRTLWQSQPNQSDNSFLLSGASVLFDEDLAALYDVETRSLLQAVKRNIERFPPDFMFELSAAECTALRSQSVTSKPGRGG